MQNHLAERRTWKQRQSMPLDELVAYNDGTLEGVQSRLDSIERRLSNLESGLFGSRRYSPKPQDRNITARPGSGWTLLTIVPILVLWLTTFVLIVVKA
jgi:hypothetical protein